MKKIVIILIISCAIININYVKAQWKKQESGTKKTLYSIYFTDTVNGWAVGDSGSIIKYDGNKWEVQLSGTDKILYSVVFINRDKGFAVGQKGTILKTTNGGQNWEQINIGVSNLLTSIDFPDDMRGYIVGDSGIVLRTDNGGDSWYIKNKILSDSSYIILNAIKFINSDTGYAGGTFLFKTVNGGKNWNKLSNGDTLMDINSISFPSRDTGYITIAPEWGIKGRICKTSDAGRTWKTIYAGGGWNYSIYFINNSIGYIASTGNCSTVGARSVIIDKTTDGGQNWRSFMIDTLGFCVFYSIYFTDTINGWVAGPSGTILHTNNGGTIINHSNLINIKNAITTKVYPNPISKLIKYIFELPAKSYVTIDLFDITGKQMINPIYELKEKGKYRKDIDISKLKSGIYFIELKVGDKKVINKLIIYN